jgi:hypothetical protein
MKKIMKQGDKIPLFYGIAYMDYEKKELVCYPLIINLVAVLIRDTWYWLKNPKRG